ncbi:MAG TPA: molybdopterin cofactor-binding domain-containing protein [Caulobacteraceae bacterium]|nr:molybdopterin cofactor-binding domain-containing protein [Caulobacteraceae bacterium]
MTDLPPALAAQPRLDTWIGFEDQGHVRVATGKVEIGQGVLTAIAQIAAEELQVDPARVRMQTARTDGSPNEGITAGSMSIETSGAALRIVAAEARSLFLQEAGRRLSCDPATLSLSDGRVLRDGRETGLDYWRLKDGVDLSQAATGTVPPRSPLAYSVVGQVFPRIDLAERLTGAPFVHDLDLPGLTHARVLHRPWPGARLPAGPIAVPDGIAAVRIDDFLALAGDDELAVARAAAALKSRLAWTGGRPYAPADATARRLLELPAEPRPAETPGDARTGQVAATVEAEYSRPYVSHASVGLCCAVAQFEDGRLTVWSHTQGPYPLRNALARALALAPEAVTVIHMPGGGSYGHNGADDVAFDAALVAHARPGRPVRLLWTRADEIAASPVGPAMLVRLSADLDADGLPLRWTSRVWSGPHARRPGLGPATNLKAAEAITRFPEDPPGDELPLAGGGGALRNAIAGYDIPGQALALNIVRRPPLRTSALRGLGATANVFALESFIDELAAAAGRDPLDYRLALTRDPRARRVIETAAQMGDFASRGAGGEGRGKGLAYARYKNRGGYLAAVAEVEAGEGVRVTRLWLACDAGLIINPDGAVNQIEGGAVQAVSWTLKEAVEVAPSGFVTDSWATYPILRFSETPVIETRLVGDPTDPPLGLGEVSGGPVSAAVANAVAHAVGVRIRDLPITRERLVAALA